MIRWTLALAWTGLLCVLLLQSSAEPVIGPAAPPGPASPVREILLTIGHIGGFSVLIMLWFWSLSGMLSFHRALLGAITIALVLGTTTEVLQNTIPDRSASLWDLVVNWVVTLAVAGLITLSRDSHLHRLDDIAGRNQFQSRR